jgi:hypothetical protein
VAAAPGWNLALNDWRHQTAARFGRRAHNHFGRGFVLIDLKDADLPVYVTQLAGAPAALFREVQQYSPDHETVLVCEDGDAPGSFVVRRIKIERDQ